MIQWNDISNLDRDDFSHGRDLFINTDSNDQSICMIEQVCFSFRSGGVYQFVVEEICQQHDGKIREWELNQQKHTLTDVHLRRQVIY